MAQKLPVEVIQTLLRVSRDLAADNDLQDLADAIDATMHDETAHLMDEIDRMSEAEYIRARDASCFNSNNVEVRI